MLYAVYGSRRDSDDCKCYQGPFMTASVGDPWTGPFRAKDLHWVRVMVNDEGLEY
jgi:hypothetical protein